MHNTHKIILAGFGGQGMLLCGQVLGYAAMRDGFHVTWFPTYGAEMRGGAAACSVVISSKPVGSPVVPKADLVAVMSQPAFDKYHRSVADNGILLYNSDIVTVKEKRDNVRYIGVGFSRLAADLGNPVVANMIVLGSLNELLQCVSVPALFLSVENKFGEKKAALLELNRKAIEMGIGAVCA